MGFALALIAFTLGWCLMPIGLPFFFISICKRRFKGFSSMGINIAICIDVLCGILYADFLNWAFVKKGSSHLYGQSPYRTISEDTGVIFYLGMLNDWGERLVRLLDYLDPYHIQKALGMSVPEVIVPLPRRILRFAVVLLCFAFAMLNIAAVMYFLFIFVLSLKT